jgi:hypothetical protein
MEETVTGTSGGAILGSASNGARVVCSLLAYGNPAAERRSIVVEQGFDAEQVRALLALARRRNDRAAEFTRDGPRAGSADLDVH